MVKLYRTMLCPCKLAHDFGAGFLHYYKGERGTSYHSMQHGARIQSAYQLLN